MSKYKPLLDTKGNRVPNLYIYEKSGVIYIRKAFKKLGIPELFRSTGEYTIGKAKSVSEEIINQHKNFYLGISDGGNYRKKKKITFKQVALEVLATVTPKKRKRTQANHALYIGQLIDYWGNWDVTEINTKHFEAYISELQSEKSRKTFLDYAKNFNLVMRCALYWGYLTSPVKVKNPDPTKQVGRVYTEDEIRRLWENMGTDLKDQFVLSYECMMRLREVLFLRWDQVDLETGKITLSADDVKTGSKTGKGRSFYCSPHALKRLKWRRHRVNHPKYIFPSYTGRDEPVFENRTAWNTAKKKAKIEGRARWHDLRHTAITKALCEQKLNPLDVSEYAGVSIATIQKVYLHSKAEDTSSVSLAVRVDDLYKKGVDAPIKRGSGQNVSKENKGIG